MAFGKSCANQYSTVYSKVSQATIAQTYLGVNRIPKLINSPLRKDKKASFGLFQGSEGKIFYKDYATGDSGDIIKLLSKMWNVDYQEVTKRIYNDFISGEPEISQPKKTLKIYKRSDIKIDVKIRNWEQHDIEYWNSYGVSKEWLIFANVYPISHEFIVKDGQTYVFEADKYAYVFIENKDDNISIKIYQPFNTSGFKWTSKHDSSVISLWTKIPEKGESLCVCSSVKDALCLWSNTGVPSISMQGEGYNMKDSVAEELKSRFDNIYVLYDNDAPGLKDGEEFAKRHGFKNLVLPQFDEGKDVSDFYKAKGKQIFLSTIKNLFK